MMLKPDANKTAARELAARALEEYKAMGKQVHQIETGVAGGLTQSKYMKRSLRGAVKPLGSR